MTTLKGHPELSVAVKCLSVVFANETAVLHRPVSLECHSAHLSIPAPPRALVADWRREILGQLGLEPGDIDVMPLARTRRRWAQMPMAIDAVGKWLLALDMPDVLQHVEPALMGCRGTPYHHDGERYGDKVFCNLFLGPDADVDLHMPAAGVRLPVHDGTVVLFDPSQPHALVRRSSAGFATSDFADGAHQSQVFLTWELPLANAVVARSLGLPGVGVPADPARATGIWCGDQPLCLCAATGECRA